MSSDWTFRLLLAVSLCATAVETRTGQTIRISASSDGDRPNHQTTRHAAMSGDGMKAAFSGTASNLVPDDTNGPGE